MDSLGLRQVRENCPLYAQSLLLAVLTCVLRGQEKLLVISKIFCSCFLFIGFHSTVFFYIFVFFTSIIQERKDLKIKLT